MDAARAQLRSVEMEAASSDARVRQVDDLVDRSSVLNPQGGTVLATYTRAGETVQAGQPLYRIASLDTLILRVYVTGDQLGTLRLGQELDVHFEGVGGDSGRSGIVEWISPSAEFTPTPIQTRDERATLVYAVKVRVPNDDGALKIGMPGDVTFRGGGPGVAGGEGGEGGEGGAEVQAGEAGESSAEVPVGAELAEGVR